MHRRLDVAARQARRQRLGKAEGDDAGSLGEAAARPEAAAVDRDRHHRQSEGAIEAGEARLQRRPLGLEISRFRLLPLQLGLLAFPLGFDDLEEVRHITERWLEEYNTIRPHEALQGLPPRQFALQHA